MRAAKAGVRAASPAILSLLGTGFPRLSQRARKQRTGGETNGHSAVACSSRRLLRPCLGKRERERKKKKILSSFLSLFGVRGFVLYLPLSKDFRCSQVIAWDSNHSYSSKSHSIFLYLGRVLFMVNVPRASHTGVAFRIVLGHESLQSTSRSYDSCTIIFTSIISILCRFWS